MLADGTRFRRCGPACRVDVDCPRMRDGSQSAPGPTGLGDSKLPVEALAWTTPDQVSLAALRHNYAGCRADCRILGNEWTDTTQPRFPAAGLGLKSSPAMPAVVHPERHGQGTQVGG